jgi:hypothetical protein
MKLIIMNAKTCEKEINMQTALQKVVMTLKIKHIHMKKATQHSQIIHTQTTTS